MVVKNIFVRHPDKNKLYQSQMEKVSGVISYNLRKQDSTSNKRCIFVKIAENKIIIKNMRKYLGKYVEKTKKWDIIRV